MNFSDKLNNSKKQIISVVLLIVMLLLIVGISLAIYNYGNIGEINRISTGQITMSYTEPSNALEISDARRMGKF